LSEDATLFCWSRDAQQDQGREWQKNGVAQRDRIRWIIAKSFKLNASSIIIFQLS
jgi:hypothetical protein